jgi:glycosyltransferase involved in cell wall biosynthesis
MLAPMAREYDHGVLVLAQASFDARVRVALVIPCYNEEHRLPIGMILDALNREPWLGLVLVDDGSRDRTRPVLEGLAAMAPDRTAVIALVENRGKAEAVRQGLRYASRSGVPFVGYWDADLATPLDEVPRFLAELDAHPECEWSIGSRVRLLGRRIERRPLRHYLGRVFATGASLGLGLPVYDTQCGAKLFRNSPLLAKCIEQPFVSRWIFDVELLGRLTVHSGGSGRDTNRIVREIPLVQWVDVSGSKVSAMSFVRAAVELLTITAAIRRSRSEVARLRPTPG